MPQVFRRSLRASFPVHDLDVLREPFLYEAADLGLELRELSGDSDATMADAEISTRE